MQKSKSEIAEAIFHLFIVIFAIGSGPERRCKYLEMVVGPMAIYSKYETWDSTG